MGAHRDSKLPIYDEEEATDEFVRLVRDILRANRAANKLAGKGPGDVGYKISTQAELARATTKDGRLLSRIIGPVRQSSPWDDRIYSSSYVGAIRDALGIPHPKYTAVTVLVSRSDIAELLNKVPEGNWEQIAAAVRSLTDEK